MFMVSGKVLEALNPSKKVVPTLRVGKFFRNVPTTVGKLCCLRNKRSPCALKSNCTASLCTESVAYLHGYHLNE